MDALTLFSERQLSANSSSSSSASRSLQQQQQQHIEQQQALARRLVAADASLLARVNAPTLLPDQLATIVTSVALAARVSLRAAALFIEAVLEGARCSTATGLGLSRRMLITAVASAKYWHYAANALNQGVSAITATVPGGKAIADGVTDPFMSVLEHYTNVGVHWIHSTFTLAELFTMSSFYLVNSTIQTTLAVRVPTLSLALCTRLTGDRQAAEESVALIDSLFGSNETSRALSSIIALVRRELTEDPRFATVAERGAIASVTALTKALTAFVCLQTATHRRSLKEMGQRVLYDCTIVIESERAASQEPAPPTAAPPPSSKHRHSASISSLRGQAPFAGPPSTGVLKPSMSVRSDLGLHDDLLSNAEVAHEPHGDEPDQAIARQLHDLMGDLYASQGDDDYSEDVSMDTATPANIQLVRDGGEEDTFPAEVEEAIMRDIVANARNGGGGAKRTIAVQAGKEGSTTLAYEIEIEETTTMTATVRATQRHSSVPPSRSSRDMAVALPGRSTGANAATTGTMSSTRTSMSSQSARVYGTTSASGTSLMSELDDDYVEHRRISSTLDGNDLEGAEDGWVDLYSRRGSGHSDQLGAPDGSLIPMAPNGHRESRAYESFQETLNSPDQGKQKLQVRHERFSSRSAWL